SNTLIDRSKTPGVSSTYLHRFGSLRNAYKLIGYNLPPCTDKADENARKHRKFYCEVVERIQQLDPNCVRIVKAGKAQKVSIEVDGSIFFSIFICGKCARKGREGRRPWLLRMRVRDTQEIALICTLDAEWHHIVAYYLKRPGQAYKGNSHLFYENDPW